MAKVFRKGTTVTVTRPYSTDAENGDIGTGRILAGTEVRIVACGKTDFGCRIYDVTDGNITIRNLPRHVLK